MTQRFILGVDAGQTMVKAVVHDENLAPVGVGRRMSPINTSLPRQLQRSQDELWEAAADAIGEAVTSARIDAKDIVAIGIAGHGDGLHLIDEKQRAVGPAITAVDSRAHAEADELLADADRARTVLERSGQVPTAGSPGVLLRWLVTHHPELVDRASVMLSCKDVVRMRLTGQVATDFSDASASFLDIRMSQTQMPRWSPEVLAAYGLTGLERLLPDVLCAGDSGGTVQADAADRTGLAEGTPAIVGMHDVQAAAIGMGALIPGRLALVAGSFSTNGVTTTQADVDPRWQSRLSIRPDLRIAMSTSPTAAPALNWLLELLGVVGNQQRDQLFAEAAALDPQQQVPLMLPFLYASPLSIDASAVFAGLHHWHSRAHVLRGMLEGIALMHYWHTSALAERFSWDETIALGGGLARSPLYVQLVANVLRAPIQVIDNDEPGAFGSAALAGVSHGIFPSIEVAQNKVQRERPVLPTAASASYWQDVRDAFDDLDSSLQPWWKGERR